MNGKVLITGANGFTGIHLSGYLAQFGYDVVGTCNSDSPKSSLISLDITCYESVRDVLLSVRPDYIIHLAAVSFVGHSEELDFYRVNVFGSLNLLNAIKDINLNVKKVLISSSANVYGNNPDVEVLKEDCTPKPVNHYAMSKLAMENLCGQYTSLPIVFSRPFNYTGPGQDARFLVPKIVKHFKEGKTEIELGNIDVYRDFSDIRDVCRYYKALMEVESCTGVYNICSQSTTSIRDIIQHLEALSGHNVQVKVNPKFVRDNEIRVLSGCSEKLNADTGLMSKYNIEDTLELMYLEGS